MFKLLASLRESLYDGIADIRSHWSRSILQVVGIVLGVASVVATFGLIDGGRRQMNDFFDRTGGIRKMLVRNKDVRTASQTAADRASKGLTYDDAVLLQREATELELVEPTIQDQKLVRAPGYEKTLEISGATWAYEPMYDFHPAEGRFITADDLAQSAKVVVLGEKRRRQIFGSGPALGRTLSIGGSSYTVVGVMEKKEFYFNSANDNALDWMNQFVFVPVTTVMNRMSGDRQGQKVAYINVQAKDAGRMDKAQRQAEAVLRRAHGAADFEVFNRAARMKQQQEQGKIYEVTFLVCGTISLLVGGIVIMNILLASFNERVREVGTRKALGANGLNIMAQFLVESVVVTIFGGLAGVALGGAFTRVISDLIQQPVVLSPQIALIGMAFATVIGVVFGFYPAVKAARLNPIQALRYE